MYESSGSQFFRTIIEIKLGPDTFDKSKLSTLEFLEKFLANNFSLSDAEDNTSGALNRGSIADLLLWRTLLSIAKSRESQDSGLFVLLEYASLTASKTLLQ